MFFFRRWLEFCIKNITVNIQNKIIINFFARIAHLFTLGFYFNEIYGPFQPLSIGPIVVQFQDTNSEDVMAECLT